MTPTIAISLFAIGYLIGSIPTGYLVVKYTLGLDLRKEGSTNIGALNTYAVTGSMFTGLLVGALDAVKGSIVVLVALLIASFVHSSMYLPGPYPPVLMKTGIALLGAIAGHNYNLWLSLCSKGLQGGKGLATAAGGLLLIRPVLVTVWIALFFAGWWLSGAIRGQRQIIIGNIFSTALIPLAALLMYDAVVATIILCAALLIIPKHFSQLRLLLHQDEERRLKKAYKLSEIDD